MIQGKKYIVIAEDNELLRSFLDNVLKNLGYNVLAAENGLRALELIKKYSKSIQLLITDIIMPKMDGKELADLISKTFPQIKILFSTGYSYDNSSADKFLANGIHFIQKPYKPKELNMTIKRLIK